MLSLRDHRRQSAANWTRAEVRASAASPQHLPVACLALAVLALASVADGHTEQLARHYGTVRKILSEIHASGQLTGKVARAARANFV